MSTQDKDAKPRKDPLSTEEMSFEAREELRRRSPDGMPPRSSDRATSKVVLIVAIVLAAIAAGLAIASAALDIAGLFFGALVVMLVAILGGLPAIFAAILRGKEKQQAQQHAIKR